MKAEELIFDLDKCKGVRSKDNNKREIVKCTKLVPEGRMFCRECLKND